MRSGDPAPATELRLILDTKANSPSPTMEVVGEASRWLKAQLKGAQVEYEYFACEEPHYGYSEFTIVRRYSDNELALSLKLAEIRGEPYAFAEVQSLGRVTGTMFPFFGSLRSENDRELLLHYIADFLLGGAR